MTRTTLAAACLAALAGTGPAALEGPLTNVDVVALTEAGLGPAAIVAKIERSETSFDTTVTALVSLARKGVADEVVEAMVATGGPAPATETRGTREAVTPRPSGTSEAEPPIAPTGRPAVGEDHYLAVATSPPAGFRFDPSERGYLGLDGTQSRTTTRGRPQWPSVSGRGAAGTAPSTPAAPPSAADALDSQWRSGVIGVRTQNVPTS